MFVLLGGRGYVGSEFYSSLKARGVDVTICSRNDCNYTRRADLAEYLKSVRADFVINCAGYTGKPNISACELHRAECLAANAVLPGKIREVCEDLGMPWGHVSTGCIYQGRRADGGGFTENDEPNFDFRHNNCSFYSGSKALGEEVLEGAKDCYVWRLRMPFDGSSSPKDFLNKLLKFPKLIDAENSISHLGDFVEAALDSVEKRIPSGVYNMTNEGSITTRHIAEILHEEAFPDREFEFFENGEESLKALSLVPRANCVLNNSKLREAGVTMRPVEDAVKDAARMLRLGV